MCIQGDFHAYSVYLLAHIWCTWTSLSTHIWCICAHMWCTEHLQHIDSEWDGRLPVYLYGIPVWIACSSSVHCGNSRNEDPRREPPPPTGERCLRRSAHDSWNMRRRGKDQHAVVPDFKVQRGVHPANSLKGVECLCAKTGSALRSIGIS